MDIIILCCVIFSLLLTIGMIVWIVSFLNKLSLVIDNIKKNTEVQVNKNVSVIEYSKSNIQDLVVSRSIPWDVYKREPEEEIIDYVTELISKDLAKSIVPFIDYREENDYVRNERVYHARIRVVGK